MRRNCAPSQRSGSNNTSTPNSVWAPNSFRSPTVRDPLLTIQQEEPNVSGSLQQGSGQQSETKYFSVVWCKKSGRKHKKWEGDAVLVVKKDLRLAILNGLDGKEITRGSSLPFSSLSSLEVGGTISFGGREIEIMEDLRQETVENLKKKAADEKISIDEDEAKSSLTTNQVLIRKPFQKPTMKRHQMVTNQAEIQRSMFDTANPQAVVLPRPPSGYFNASAPIVDVVVDPHLSKHLRPHQRDGIIFLYECLMGFRTPNSYGAILADEMGLGKTLQSISLIWTMLKQGPKNGKPIIKRALVLAPSSLVKNWQMEFEKWLGNERIQTYAVDQSTKVSDYSKNPRQPVLIMSYEMFTRSTELLESVNFDILVCDEGHRLKNNQVKASQSINQMGVDRRLVLTGTPLQNDLKEFYTIVNLVSPGSLGTPQSFTKIYEVPIVASKQPGASAEEIYIGEEKTEDLNHLTSQFILRRTQDIISKYLPPKVESVIFCAPSSLQTYLYEEVTGSLNSDLDLFFDTKFVLSSIMMLRKICNHPSIFLEDEANTASVCVPQELADLTHEEQGSKLAFVSALLWSLRQKGDEKIVIVSISTRVLNTIQDLCEHYKYPHLRLDGSTTTTQRQQVVSRFNSVHSKDFVLLLSSKAGGTGLNLVGASRILLYDLDWNPANDTQAMSRVWRDGQTRKVHIYRLVTVGTIEEKIFQRQLNKKGLGGGILDTEKPGAAQQFHFSKDELKDLFSFHGDDPACNTHTLLGCNCDGDGTNCEDDSQNVQQENSRSCQLVLPSTSTTIAKTQTQDLMKWKHIDPKVEGILADDPVLQDCGNFISFIFKNEANSFDEN